MNKIQVDCSAPVEDGKTDKHKNEIKAQKDQQGAAQATSSPASPNEISEGHRSFKAHPSPTLRKIIPPLPLARRHTKKTMSPGWKANKAQKRKQQT